MSSLKYRAIGAAFEILSRTHITRLIRQAGKCKGVIFTLHRVLPETPPAFAPNAILQVTPSFLESVIVRTRALDFEIVSIDEAIARVEADEKTKPFVVLTFDDAYRDNLTHALPILRKHQCPFTLYVPTAFIDGQGEIWWQALEDIIRENDRVYPGTETPLDTATLAQKQQAFKSLYWRMRDMPEPDRVALMQQVADRHEFELHAHCRELVMTWDELDTFVKEPLCTIGAHTVHHYELAKLPEEEARAEIADSMRIISDKTGIEPQHFAYPVGARRSAGDREFALASDLGLRTAVTTRPGGLREADRSNLHMLPRISLNGLYQKPRYVDVFLTGTLFSLLGERM